LLLLCFKKVKWHLCFDVNILLIWHPLAGHSSLSNHSCPRKLAGPGRSLQALLYSVAALCLVLLCKGWRKTQDLSGLRFVEIYSLKCAPRRRTQKRRMRMLRTGKFTNRNEFFEYSIRTSKGKLQKTILIKLKKKEKKKAKKVQMQTK
jgi:hypothetical protein